jgi:hypothetical protein
MAAPKSQWICFILNVSAEFPVYHCAVDTRLRHKYMCAPEEQNSNLCIWNQSFVHHAQMTKFDIQNSISTQLARTLSAYPMPQSKPPSHADT